MRKKLLLIFCTLISGSAFGQKTFIVDSFSRPYYGKVFIDHPEDVFSPGWVAIYSRKTGKQLIKVSAKELSHSGLDGERKPNIVQRPYGFQSSIIYQDFNFDGKKDFALMDGQMSCYHGPSFSIYLATDEGFQLSPAFTRLAHEYCGLFGVDSAKQTLHTMTKSGCCWHQYSTFKVKNNQPYPVKIIEEGMSYAAPIREITVSEKLHGKMKITQSTQLLDTTLLQKEDLLLTFDVKHGKRLRLMTYGDGRLVYIFTRGADTVELWYNEKFHFDTTRQVLSFHRKNIGYKIYRDKIQVTMPKRTATQRAEPQSIQGALLPESLSNMKNVIVSGRAPGFDGKTHD